MNSSLSFSVLVLHSFQDVYVCLPFTVLSILLQDLKIKALLCKTVCPVEPFNQKCKLVDFQQLCFTHVLHKPAELKQPEQAITSYFSIMSFLNLYFFQ